MSSLLSPEKLQEFRAEGVVVIDHALSEEKVEETREAFHRQLLQRGVNHRALLSHAAEPQTSVRIKGIASSILHNRFKIELLLEESIHQTFLHALREGIDERPFGEFEVAFPMIDRVCYRLPDSILEEGGLNMHIDRNPYHSNHIKKYRPIQGFLALTDHFGSESGGLKVVKGFHHRFHDYFKEMGDSESTDEEGGEFYRLHSKRHTKLQNELQPVNCAAGSLVLWNNKLPHATCSKLTSFDTREVVYLSYLPDCELNRKFWKQQSVDFLSSGCKMKYLTGRQKGMLGI